MHERNECKAARHGKVVPLLPPRRLAPTLPAGGEGFAANIAAQETNQTQQQP